MHQQGGNSIHAQSNFINLSPFSIIHNNNNNNKFILQALPDEFLPMDITEPGKLDEIFDLMDANNDGRVTFEEFKAAMQRDSSLQDVVLSSLRQT